MLSENSDFGRGFQVALDEVRYHLQGSPYLEAVEVVVAEVLAEAIEYGVIAPLPEPAAIERGGAG